MPAYNHAPFIGQALASACQQSLTDLEVIVFDDGSRDRTRDIAAAFADDRVHVYSSDTNRGDGPSRNRCLELARGRYVAWLDSDDRSPMSRLQTQLSFLESHPKVGVVGGGAIPTDGEGRPIGLPVFPPRSSEAIFWGHIFGSPLIHGTTMVRRDVYDNLGGYLEDTPIGSDNEFLLRCCERAVPMAGLSKILLMYRRHHTNITDTFREDSIKFSARLTQEALSRLLQVEVEAQLGSLLRAPRLSNPALLDPAVISEAFRILDQAAARFDKDFQSSLRGRVEIRAERSVRRVTLGLAATGAPQTTFFRLLRSVRLSDLLWGLAVVLGRRLRGVLWREALRRR